MVVTAILFLLTSAYFMYGYFMQVGVDKGYEPIQPIHYSHKIHAGENGIDCKYCHSSARVSKNAGIPSLNVCMNCHKTIQSYEKGPKLYDADGKEVDGTAEIQKLYKYAGFDPKNPSQWDPSKSKPIEWVKIHNLPDHVFFDHSQHIRVGNVQCQTCHGEITAMDEVKQESELSMGWCVNCHRETKVAFNYNDVKGNKFYSIYEKFHNDIKALEVGAALDLFPKEIPIMAFTKNKQVFLSFYITLIFYCGARGPACLYEGARSNF